LGIAHSGWSAGSGSGSVTSRAAEIRPPARASVSASVSATGPRAALTSSAPSGIAARKPASTIPRVCGVSGTISTTTSASGSSLGSSSTPCTASCASPAGRAVRATQVRDTSNGASRAPIAAPIEPAPTTSTRLPANSSVGV
jgi:hypothetical protein